MVDMNRGHLRLKNRLLSALSAEDLELLGPDLEAVTLELGDEIVNPRAPISHLYFPESGLLATVSAEPGKTVEIGLVGFEGVSGSAVFLESRQMPWRTTVQKPGTAHRIRSDRMMEACRRSSSLFATMLRYVHVTQVQMAEAARVNALINVETRLARWLLMVHDRTEGDELKLTHDALAMMLGVRRPGVTAATHILEGNRLIRARRGRICVLDRVGLEAAASGSYGVPEAEYDRLFPPRPTLVAARSTSGILDATVQN